MAKRVDCYAIAITTLDGAPTSRSMLEFFRRLNDIVERNWLETRYIVNYREMRLFSNYPDLPSVDRIVVPFGKRIAQGATFAVDEKDGAKLSPIHSKLYHVNSLAYSKAYNIALLTTYRDGPRPGEIESYLTQFLDPAEGYVIRLFPIKRRELLERIRRAKEVKSITMSMNLRPTEQKFYKEHAICEHEGLLQGLKKMISAGKEDLGGNAFSFSLGLGQGSKRADSLDKDAAVSFLTALELEADVIKEVVLTFRDESTETIDVRKLKNEMIVSGMISGDYKQVSPEVLRENMVKIIDDLFPKFNDEVQRIFADTVKAGEEYVVRYSKEGEMIAQ